MCVCMQKLTVWYRMCRNDIFRAGVCNWHMQISAHRDVLPARKHSMLQDMPEDETGTERRTAVCVEMLRLIISIISSSGRRSANVWHASASVDMRQSWLNEWWNEARWEKNKTASWEKRRGEKNKKTLLWMSGKVTGECTISYNSDLNPTKKKEQREEKSYTPMAMKLLIS